MRGSPEESGQDSGPGRGEGGRRGWETKKGLPGRSQKGWVTSVPGAGCFAEEAGKWASGS